MRIRKAVLSAAIIMSIAFAATASAAPIWGTSALDDLTGSRSSGSGIVGTQSWDDGGFSLAWNIFQTGDNWTYTYTVNVDKKDVSHFILEVTDNGGEFALPDGTDSGAVSPDTYTETSDGNSNPGLPNPVYGVKFDFGASSVTHTLVTDRAPVWGVFYAKSGKDKGKWVYAYSSALGYADYMTNEGLSVADFIVRPDGDSGLAPTGDPVASSVPVPAAVWLLASGILGLIGFRRR